MRQSLQFGRRKKIEAKPRQPKRPTAIPPEEPLPMVHCVLATTSRRRWCIERAIKCWLQQDYPEDRRRLVIIDGPNEVIEVDQPHVITLPPMRGETTVHDLVPDHPRIHYIRLKPGEPGRPGDKFNLGCSLADESDLIALWADDDWHHKQRISLVVDGMRRSGAVIGGTTSMMIYRQSDKQLYLYTHPYAVDPLSPSEKTPEGQTDVDVPLPYLIGGTMIFPKTVWGAVEGFKPMMSGTDSEFITRAVTGCESWDVQSIRVAPDYGDNCCVASYLTTRRDGAVFESSIIQLNEPRLYCAVVHGENTGNPIRGGKPGGGGLEEAERIPKLGVEAIDQVRRWMGDAADEFLGAREV